MEQEAWSQLIEQVKKEGTHGTGFAELIRQLEQLFARALSGKGFPLEEYEDDIQDFLARQVIKSVEEYDPSYNTKFTSYILGLFWKRIYREGLRRKDHRELYPLTLDSPQGVTQARVIDTLPEDRVELDRYIAESIRDFFREGIASLGSERMQQALYFRFCVPVRLGAKEIADIMGTTEGNYSSALYVGLKGLKRWADERKEQWGFDYADFVRFLEQDTLALDWRDLKDHKDPTLFQINEAFYAHRKSVQQIATEWNQDVTWVRDKLREGLLWIIKQGKILQRSGGSAMHTNEPSQEELLAYLDSLDEPSEFTTRKASTGNADWDAFLKALHSSFEKNDSNPLLSDQVLDMVNAYGISLEVFASRFGYSPQEMTQILSDDADSALKARVQHHLKELNQD